MARKTKEDWLRSLSSKDLQNRSCFRRAISSGETEKFYQAKLEETVFGQAKACRAVAKALTRSDAGLNLPDRPEFIGMFLGEPGCGKTEMGRAIAKTISPSEWEKHLLIIDCNGLQDGPDIHKISGSSPMYVGYGDNVLIMPEVLQKPNVIVFDEIEKAHSDLHRLLLGIFDKGKLTVPLKKIVTRDNGKQYYDTAPVELNFANSKIILTSNIGSAEINRARKGSQMGFVPEAPADKSTVEKTGLRAVQQYWRHMPEFLNRVDNIIVFEPLTLPVYEKVFDKFITEYNDAQSRGQNFLAVTRELRSWIVSQIDQSQGGRALRNTIEEKIITPMAEVKAEVYESVPLIADLSDKGEVYFVYPTRLQEKARQEYQRIRQAITVQSQRPQHREKRWIYKSDTWG